MTDWETPEPVPMQGKETAMVAYVLLIASPLLFFTGIIAIVISYVYRDESPEWLQSHYTLIIRTFWISLLVGALSAPLVIFFIGYLILLLWLIWFLVRCVKGIRMLSMGRPHPNPRGWWF